MLLTWRELKLLWLEGSVGGLGLVVMMWCKDGREVVLKNAGVMRFHAFCEMFFWDFMPFGPHARFPNEIFLMRFPNEISLRDFMFAA